MIIHYVPIIIYIEIDNILFISKIKNIFTNDISNIIIKYSPITIEEFD